MVDAEHIKYTTISKNEIISKVNADLKEHNTLAATIDTGASLINDRRETFIVR